MTENCEDGIIFLKGDDLTLYYCFDTEKPIKTVMVGREHLVPPVPHKTRFAPDGILYYVTEGELKLRDGDETVCLEPGDVYIFSKGDFQKPLAVTDCTYFYLHFGCDAECREYEDGYIKKELSRLGAFFMRTSPYTADGYAESIFFLPKKMRVSDTACASRLCRLFGEAARRQRSRRPFFKTDTELISLEILLTLFRTFSEHTLKGTAKLDDETIRHIAVYLSENLEKRFTGDMLARYSGYSFDYLDRRFREVTGQTVFGYLAEARMHEAMMLLESRSATVGEVAERCGYCDVYYFSRAFKKRNGVSPKEWMRREENLPEKR